MLMYYITQKGAKVRTRAPHNTATWDKVREGFNTFNELTHEQLMFACRNHDHPAGAFGFIEYMIDRGWVTNREVTSE